MRQLCRKQYESDCPKCFGTAICAFSCVFDRFLFVLDYSERARASQSVFHKFSKSGGSRRTAVRRASCGHAGGFFSWTRERASGMVFFSDGMWPTSKFHPCLSLRHASSRATAAIEPFDFNESDTSNEPVLSPTIATVSFLKLRPHTIRVANNVKNSQKVWYLDSPGTAPSCRAVSRVHLATKYSVMRCPERSTAPPPDVEASN